MGGARIYESESMDARYERPTRSEEANLLVLAAVFRDCFLFFVDEQNSFFFTLLSICSASYCPQRYLVKVKINVTFECMICKLDILLTSPKHMY